VGSVVARGDKAPQTVLRMAAVEHMERGLGEVAGVIAHLGAGQVPAHEVGYAVDLVRET
jgi:hypothetical protein